MPRGRPATSIVRARLAEILFLAGKLTAYDAHKHYIKIFAATTRRNVYYQLQRGEEEGLFGKEVVEEQGEYSWGEQARKTYYYIKEKSGITINPAIQKYFEEEKKNE